MEGPFDEGTKTRLQWYSIAGVKNAKGELLAAFELFEVCLIIFSLVMVFVI